MGFSNNTIFSRNIGNTQNRQNIAFQRLASMRRLNSAKDDPVGIAVVNRLSSQINSADQGIRNANDGISFSQTAQSGLSQISSNLQRMRTLTLQASNSVVGNRDAIQNEINQLTQANTSISESSSFNGQSIFPTENKTVSFQIGPNGENNHKISVDLKSVDALATVDVSSASKAQSAIEQIDAQIDAVSQQASNFGAIENRFAASISVNESISINSQASRSQINDTDVAKEMTELIKAQVLEKVGIAISAQANQSRKTILSLLGGS